MDWTAPAVVGFGTVGLAAVGLAAVGGAAVGGAAGFGNREYLLASVVLGRSLLRREARHPRLARHRRGRLRTASTTLSCTENVNKYKIPRIPPRLVANEFIMNCKKKATLFNNFFSNRMPILLSFSIQRITCAQLPLQKNINF